MFRFFKRFFTTNKKIDIKELMNELNIREKFCKGSGKGGQKINKTNSNVQLMHIPTGIYVETQRFRDLMSNRKEARKLLTLKLDLHFNGIESKIANNIAKIKKKKNKKAQRAKKKYEDDQMNPGSKD